MSLPDLARLDRCEPVSAARAAARGEAQPVTWTWQPQPAADGECPHGICDAAWCGICTPPAPERRRAR